MSLQSQHGGNLDLIERMYGINKKDIIDFSGNVNPLGLSENAKNAIKSNIDHITRYPDVSYLCLREAISAYTGVDKSFIIPGNGSTELISLFIKLKNVKKGVIISPAYSEYEREINMIGGKVIKFLLEEKDDFEIDVDKLLNKLTSNIDLLVICNPNNPTGKGCAVEMLKKILAHCATRNIDVFVDETYVEFADMNVYSSQNIIKDFSNLFIIRGTSKFFACPGLRLGYALCSNLDIVNGINEKKDPWSVNVFAAIGGESMFEHTEYINNTKEFIKRQRECLYNELINIKSIKVYESVSNFFLIKLLDTQASSEKIFKKLLRYNIVIRDCTNIDNLGEKYIRFCIMKEHENMLLIEKLKEIL